ncbi:GNAT family N-acetyltransferase [Luteimonas pelagia]
MNDDGLDNPFFSALATRHRALAQRHGDLARYPAAYAPFLGVSDPAVDAGEGLEALVAPGETVLLLGVVPRPPAGWVLEPQGELAQMVRDAPLEMPAGPEIVPLDDRDRDDVLDLVARVYPHYFRERTMDLGRYFGIREDGRLSAMIGERLGTAAATELSAICTDPACTGRGLARRLMAHLANDLLARRHLPFLHVAQHNTRAVALYERVGFRRRRTIPFFALRRVAG